MRYPWPGFSLTDWGEYPSGAQTGQKTCMALKIKIIISRLAHQLTYTGGSSNGRTAAFGVADGGSNPPPPASPPVCGYGRCLRPAPSPSDNPLLPGSDSPQKRGLKARPSPPKNLKAGAFKNF